MNTANAVLRALYWFVVGALLGVGVIAILSIGVLLLLASVPLMVLGAMRGWVREAWAGVLGAGLAPLLILLSDLQGSQSIQPVSTAQTYQLMAVIGAVIAALGLLLGIIVETTLAMRHPRQMR